MRRSKELTILLITVLAVGLVSCGAKKAREFRDTIVQKERVAFKMLVGKEGTEGQKLDYLIKGNFKEALATVDKQEKEFNELIKSIGELPVNGIKQGKELQTAAVNYYVTVRDLQLMDRIEIQHREAAFHLEGKVLDDYHKKSLQLSLEKQEQYKKVNEQEELYGQALKKFNTANGIQ